MDSVLPIVIVTHGDFGKSLLKAAEAMVGKQEQVVLVEIASGEPVTRVKERCQEIFKQLSSPEVLVLVDMLGGTPCNVVLPLVKETNAEVLTGLNLYMLLTALAHRKTMPLSELAEKVLRNGQSSMANAKTVLEGKL